VLRQVQRHGNDDHGKEEEEEGVCFLLANPLAHYALDGRPGMRNWRKRQVFGIEEMDLLKMNFSVGVNMYSENVTWIQISIVRCERV
jgi:hypothetical protein